VLAVTDRQRGFFDAAWCSDLLPEGSFYSLLAEHGERIVRDEDFADCYSERRGRPSIPPSLLAKVLLLAYRDGLSDERAMEAVRFDLRWKVALDLPVDHPGFHPTSLVRFRARLLLHGMERLVFERSLELATELGLIEGEADQIVDSTPMLGAAAVQDTATLVRSGVRKLLDAVDAADGEAAEALASGLRFDYSRPRVKPECDWHDKAAREALLAEVARDAVRALRAVEEDDELAADAEVAEAAGLLREIVGQEFEAGDDEVPRPRRGRRTRQIVSAHDPEMRHGRTTPSKRFTGYKLHAAAAVEAPVLTAISLSPANEHDGHHAGALVDQQPERRRPKRVIGDTAYGNIEARERLEERKVAVLAPVHTTSSPSDGTFSKDEFTIDLETDTVTCPRGNTAPIYKHRRNRPSATGERVARFARTDCEPCPLRQQCAPTGRRDIRISRREDLRQAALRELSNPAERDHLKRTRPLIERLLGLIVHRYRGRKSRYRGTRKSTFQAVWTAVLVNLHPIAAALRAHPA
jgi:transposase